MTNYRLTAAVLIGILTQLLRCQADIVNLDDYQREAKRILPRDLYDYAAGGGFYELTSAGNRLATQEITLWPRYMRDVSKINTTLRVLGRDTDFPIGIGPTPPFHAAYTDEGEVATAKACDTLRNIYTMNYYSTRTIEDVAAAGPNCRKWLSIYFSENRTTTENVVQRAKDSNFEALVVYIDGVNPGRRFRDLRNDLNMVQRYPPANIPESERQSIKADPTTTWKDVEWLVDFSDMPVVVKGVLHPLDAKEAIKVKASAVWISNHAGRELDTVSATLEALPDVVKEVRKEKSRKVEVYVESGFREGVDLIKAFSMGADYVFMARSTAFMLAINGSQGVVVGYSLLFEELKDVMQLAGFPTLSKIPRSLTKKCTGSGASSGMRSFPEESKAASSSGGLVGVTNSLISGVLGTFSKPSETGSSSTSGSDSTSGPESGTSDDCED